MSSRHCCSCHPIRLFFLWIATLALGLIVSGCATLPKDADGTSTARVELDTGAGRIILVIDQAAAPRATAALLARIEDGRFDGVAFDWVQPHVEIRTGAPQDDQRLPSELDAVALGLDRIRIEHAGSAMEMIQRELEPAFMQAGGQTSAQLQDWIGQWRRTFLADFLIGVSRQQINAALGYRYQQGYASRPARRGSVALVPADPGSSSLALAILLGDLPDRDGRWVVVGQVAEGLDIAEQLSVQARTHPKRHTPKEPVRIQRTRLLPLKTTIRSSP